MSPIARRNFRIFVTALLLLAACLLFPRVLAFVELAARELRYLWWLVLIVALGVWLAFFYNQKKD
jgi:hypothetical protein